MSVEAISTVLHHSQATGRAKLTLIGIANHYGDHGAWPSIQTLAKYANASERSIKRDIRELVELGELMVEVQSAPVGGQYKTNLYHVRLSCPVDCDGSFSHRVRGDRSGKNVNSGVTDQVTRGDNVGTQNVINHNMIKTNNDEKIPLYSEQFELFMQAYPKRVSKGQAWKTWQKLQADKVLPDLATLIVAANEYEKRVTDPKYRKNPSTWLNAHGWLDEPERKPEQKQQISSWGIDYRDLEQ